MVIINAPKVFGIAWTFVKPQLDEKTVAKISIFGSDQREAYVKCLLDLVDADQLPKLFGGRCVCDQRDPGSCMRAVKGPWADPEAPLGWRCVHAGGAEVLGGTSAREGRWTSPRRRLEAICEESGGSWWVSRGFLMAMTAISGRS